MIHFRALVTVSLSPCLAQSNPPNQQTHPKATDSLRFRAPNGQPSRPLSLPFLSRTLGEPSGSRRSFSNRVSLWSCLNEDNEDNEVIVCDVILIYFIFLVLVAHLVLYQDGIQILGHVSWCGWLLGHQESPMKISGKSIPSTLPVATKQRAEAPNFQWKSSWSLPKSLRIPTASGSSGSCKRR